MKINFSFKPGFEEYHQQFIQAGVFWSLFIKDERTVEISVEPSPSDGQGGLKASAAFNAVDDAGLPITGTIAVDMADMSRFAHFTETLIHEIGHALGIGTLWQKRKLLNMQGQRKCVFTGPNASAVFAEMPGRNGNELLVETGGGAVSAFGHWSEDSYNKELMTPEKDIGEHIAKFTVASLIDVGYTNVDFSLFNDPKFSKDGHTIPVSKLITHVKSLL